MSVQLTVCADLSTGYCGDGKTYDSKSANKTANTTNYEAVCCRVSGLILKCIGPVVMTIVIAMECLFHYVIQ